uniref:Drug/Metabolite Transporter (DMT) Superfamily putat n=1 Tax=Albugo laibachii Nc14 TaxID=890382 RepID=F0W706_9STRA|nr:Drug/Metabolite Transporter (DMT) Superfamily putat [Albugo laibachii Nc14]|eukprot:CCA16901.1 Drug/Metabolite Transporter (DMT) Superfamily putat [Albugo laibachii Nc14]
MLTLLDTKLSKCNAVSVEESDQDVALEKSLQESRQCNWNWWREIIIHCDHKRRDFLCCFLGILITFSTNGFVLEKVASHRHIGEFSLTFMLCGLNALFALGIHRFTKEKSACAPHKQISVLGFFAFGSTVSSVIALRYMNFITRILGKSCKAIPIMVVGRWFGKVYRPEKYLSICILCIGVAIFLVGTRNPKVSIIGTQNTSSSHFNQVEPRNLLFGMITLLVSLGCDGVTGAMEDQFFSTFQIGTFHLMYFVNIWKCCFAAIGVILTGEFARVHESVESSVSTLLLLSASGALGQVFVFLTLSKFGALTTSIFGTCRKVVSVIVSVLYFGHILSQKQVAGLLIVFSGIGINWIPFKTYFRWCDFEFPQDDQLCIEESTGLLGELEETLIVDAMESTSPSYDP